MRLGKNKAALTVDYSEPEIFEAYSIARRLLIKHMKYKAPRKMELWTPHSFPLRVLIAIRVRLLGFGVFHYVCQGRDTLPCQWATVLPQAVQSQRFHIGLILIQPHSNSLGCTEELVAGQCLNQVAVEVR